MSEEEKIMLETNQSITYMETCFRNKIKELQQENQQLKEQLGNRIVEFGYKEKKYKSVLDEEHDKIIKELCGHLPNLENDENLKLRGKKK